MLKRKILRLKMKNTRKYFIIFAMLVLCIYFLSSLKFSSFTHNSKNSNILNISVYYEAKCPDSAEFFNNQLSKLTEKTFKNVYINLVPFGKASVC